MARYKKEYIYAIQDPRLTAQDEPDFIYIGHSPDPVAAIQRHLTRSNNPEVAVWAEGLMEEFPEGLEILAHVVVDRYNGLHRDLPPVAEGRTRLEWCILGTENPPQASADSDVIIFRYGSVKSQLIDHYRQLGHPLLNKRVGRPPTAIGG